MKTFYLHLLLLFTAIPPFIAPFTRAAECNSGTPNPCQYANVDYTVKEDGSLERYVGQRKNVVNSSPAIDYFRRFFQSGDVDPTDGLDHNIMEFTPAHAGTKHKLRDDEFELCCEQPTEQCVAYKANLDFAFCYDSDTRAFQLANGGRGSLETLEFEYPNGTKSSFDELNLGFDYFRVKSSPWKTETIKTTTTKTKQAKTETLTKQEPETTESKDVKTSTGAVTSTVQKAITLQTSVTPTVRRPLDISTTTITVTQSSGGSSARGMKSKNKLRKLLVKVIAAWVALAAISGGKSCSISELNADADDVLKTREYCIAHSMMGIEARERIRNGCGDRAVGGSGGGYGRRRSGRYSVCDFELGALFASSYTHNKFYTKTIHFSRIVKDQS
ncbi:hypothetical protein L211DRAFT_893610 [Terfezia boudieri ATCC MYA-4762]|uniref:Uncharacterized protein n=1 Tax=Terfezia boudieri ATCC MYA-4762 TaxID=1051890 RepID=A0A3N4LBP4_9PEZI|nr:hypothetical protein L211DRAFT_893610 [Terfezia boudieri ATCC MYA-4762]